MRETAEIVVVTGAASGLGAAISARLRDAGKKVCGLDLHPSETDLPITLDVSDREAVTGAVQRVERELGPISALVSAAGHYEMIPFDEIDETSWRRMLSVHLGGAFNLTAATLPGMRKRGAGSIILIGSELALCGGEGDTHYAAAKGALIGFTRSLAAEVAGEGIRVNMVAPGSADTPLLAADSPWRAQEYVATLPLRRIVAPHEVAATVDFLLEEGTFFVGQVLSPNAGAVIA